MDKLLDTILESLAKLIKPGHSIQVQNILARNIPDSGNVILWNSETLDLDSETYEEFLALAKKRHTKLYQCTNVLAYGDFCIALLWSRGYTMNHDKFLLLPSNVFIAAWRALDAMADIGGEKAKKWISVHRNGRTAAGYAMSFGLGTSIDTLPEYSHTYNNENRRRNEIDASILRSALMTGNVEEIVLDSTNNDGIISIPSCSTSPESLLAIVSAYCIGRRHRD